ncbi:MAG: hypothetical protein GWM98_10955, partial [Nitrospinaceae bacterium]|nr:hypothetical protein [Nitrospinaceae bacterium]NIR52509.1 hypothetical protein [candidate division KSB1 bacterium]NIS27821.1 hypothetical protein [candidate division KSB1 bacterium]NIT82158.1 hypothetical protein [Nitrospinaceae bacterium]NIU28486.1 hypothetical protein [candidate division KSB1 bacterium]
MRVKVASILSVFALFALVSVASANVVEVEPGGKAVCENASWVVYNLSETQETDISFDIGPFAYAWDKV